MTTPADFDPLTIQLGNPTLVEANAGTGKTYSIVTLFVRLIATGVAQVDEVLVVSFTDAATAELQQRVRSRLAELRVALAQKELQGEAAAVVAECDGDLVRVQRHVDNALQAFDQASIQTIHAFCQRLLDDLAFEIGTGFDIEMLTEDHELRREVVEDFWRSATADGSGRWLGFLAKEGFVPEKLTKKFADYFTSPRTRLLSVNDVVMADIARAEQRYEAALKAFRAGWANYEGNADEQLKAGVSNASSRKAVLKRAREIGDGLKDPLKVLADKDFFARLAEHASEPVGAMARALIDSASTMEELHRSKLVHLRAELIRYGRKALRERKTELGVRHFDDLLNDLDQALQSDHADLVMGAVRQRYKVALVDEFQDTDPVQFAIFDKLFVQQKLPIFFVGDPKQSIYGFRSADVYAYLDARETVGTPQRLTTNRRSRPTIVESVNALFGRHSNAFLTEGIAFSPSKPHESDEGVPGVGLSASTWWTVAVDDKTRLSKQEYNDLVANATASEIVKLLSLDQPVDAGDIAILVRSHKQGQLLRDALAARGVACVNLGDQQVFESQEAHDVEIVLNGIVNDSNVKAVRAALSTVMLGWDAARLVQLDEDDTRWQAILDRFAALRESWARHSFGRAFQQMNEIFAVEQRLLSLRYGHRSLTNHLHLGELLQAQAASRSASPLELLDWLRQKRRYAGRDDAGKLRLETDRSLVKIQTIHYAKGLQHRFVFCPFMAVRGGYKEKEIARFHDGKTRCLDLGTDALDTHRQQAEKEELAEDIRLAYVALTRAKSYSVAAWGAVSGSEHSAVAWLLHGGEDCEHNDVATRVKSMPGSDMIAPLQQLASTDVVALPASSANSAPANADAAAGLAARQLKQPVPRARRVSSFSALVHAATDQTRDYDALSGGRDLVADAAGLSGIAAFPKGARAGRCIHSLFEHSAFDASLETLAATAATELQRHGFSTEQAPLLAKMVHDVARTPIDDRNNLRLVDISRDQRIDEMEFYFPTAGLDASALRSVLESRRWPDPIAQRIALLDFEVAHGFFHGFIDLVVEYEARFYVIDYKSNWLGAGRQAYGRDELAQEMARHDYYLQYLVYSVAVHLHLQQTVPGYDFKQHFGGVAYLFVRGMHPDNGNDLGVYLDKPGLELVAALTELLAGAAP
ncbi:MAG: exodeoxyribonuclease V subunit beta [Gammaproteobacteria bacterium]|nr:exodeoxyribonuclease V subunit beta [Gammaproteobacteria bacterium]